MVCRIYAEFYDYVRIFYTECTNACPTVKHSLTYLFTASSGVPNFPEFVGVALVDEIQVGYCDTNKVEPNNDWGKQMFSNEPDQLEFYTRQCNEIQPNVCKARIYNLKQRFNQSEGTVCVMLYLTVYC